MISYVLYYYESVYLVKTSLKITPNLITLGFNSSTLWDLLMSKSIEEGFEHLKAGNRIVGIN